MEMAQTKLVSLLAALVFLSACVPGKPDGASVGITWSLYSMDGSRTGVAPCIGEDVASAFGTVENGIYHSPCGKAFSDSSVVNVVSIMTEAQPRVAYLKVPVAFSTVEMRKSRPQSLLSNWTADVLKKGVETACGKKTDVSIINFGGIRLDLPQGVVLYDDIASMFPFLNYLCWVQLRGEDLERLFSDMVEANNLQAFSGAELIVEGDKLVSLKIAGNSVEPNQLYGVGTVDFLLDGGDRIYVARNSVDLIVSKSTVRDCILSYVNELTASGHNIESSIDDRITIL